MSDINKLVQFIRVEFNRSLKLFPLPNKPEYLYDPIKFALKGKGKRFRPILIHLSGKAF
jgi:geranylgeranyl pyrophosphate synthase